MYGQSDLLMSSSTASHLSYLFISLLLLQLHWFYASSPCLLGIKICSEGMLSFWSLTLKEKVSFCYIITLAKFYSSICLSLPILTSLFVMKYENYIQKFCIKLFSLILWTMVDQLKLNRPKSHYIISSISKLNYLIWL